MLRHNDDDILTMAREQQIRINTSQNNLIVSHEELKARCASIIKSIEHVSKLKMIPRIASRLEEITHALSVFMVDTMERYALQNKNTSVYDEVLESLRGAIYRMVASLSDKEIRVSIINNKHKGYLEEISTELRSISRLLQDDTIQLDIEMDCSRDEEIARQLAAL